MSLPDAIQSSLVPNPEAVLKAQVAAPGQIDAIHDNATVDARRCMNAMKTMGAALQRAVQEDPSRQTEAFNNLLEQAHDLAKALLVRWGHNPDDRGNRWMLNVVEKGVMSYLTPFTPLPKPTVDALAQHLVQSAFDFPDLDAHTDPHAIALALFQGMCRLDQAQRQFNFGRPASVKDADLIMLRDLVISSSAQLMNDLCPEMAPTPTRVTFITLALQEAFGLMEQAWNRNAQRAQAALSPLTKEQLRAWRTANPEGFALEPIVSDFQNNITRLVRLTSAVRAKDKTKR